MRGSSFSSTVFAVVGYSSASNPSLQIIVCVTFPRFPFLPSFLPCPPIFVVHCTFSLIWLVVCLMAVRVYDGWSLLLKSLPPFLSPVLHILLPGWLDASFLISNHRVGAAASHRRVKFEIYFISFLFVFLLQRIVFSLSSLSWVNAICSWFNKWTNVGSISY